MRQLIPAIIFLTFSSAFAAMAEDNKSTIATNINNNGNITIVQPEALNERLLPVETEDQNEAEQLSSSTRTLRRAGFRIQVFADNNVRTAKTTAEAKKRNMEQRFPEFRSYVSFESPYWRVRVGDFRSHAEAEIVLEEIKKAFPSYAKDLRIVKDRINIVQ